MAREECFTLCVNDDSCTASNDDIKDPPECWIDKGGDGLTQIPMS